VETKCDRSLGEGNLHTHTLWREPGVAVTPHFETHRQPLQFCLGSGADVPRTEDLSPICLAWSLTHALSLFPSTPYLLTSRPSKSDPQQLWPKSKPKHDCTTELCHLPLGTSLLPHLRKPLQGPHTLQKARPLLCPRPVVICASPTFSQIWNITLQTCPGEVASLNKRGQDRRETLQLILGHGLRFPSEQGPSHFRRL